jgi:hypothetical protein
MSAEFGVTRLGELGFLAGLGTQFGLAWAGSLARMVAAGMG